MASFVHESIELSLRSSFVFANARYYYSHAKNFIIIVSKLRYFLLHHHLVRQGPRLTHVFRAHSQFWQTNWPINAHAWFSYSECTVLI